MDTQAFQHLLSLFPLLTLRQRRLAQQELTPPLTPSPRWPLNFPYANAALTARPRPHSWLPGAGLEGCAVIAASCVCAPVPLSLTRLSPDFASHNAGKTMHRPSSTV